METTNGLVFKGSGYGYSNGPEHLKIGLFEIQMCFSEIEMLFEEMSVICPHCNSVLMLFVSKIQLAFKTKQSSFGHFCALCVVFVPLEYILNIPPHFTYVMVFLSAQTIDVYMNKDV